MQYVLVSVFNLMAMLFKKYKEMFFLFLVFIWLLASFNYKIADKTNYYNSYVNAGNSNEFLSNEIGQQLFYKLFNQLGISFPVFLSLYFLIGLILISRVILKYSNNPGYVLVLYFIYPFIIDVAQIRNFMAMAIMLNAIPLLGSTRKIDVLKYLALLLIAMSFHLSAVFYMCFLLVKINIRKLFKIVVIITILTTIANELLVVSVVDLLPFLDEKMYRYTQNEVSIYTRIGLILYFIGSLVLIYIAKLKLLKNNVKLNNNSFSGSNSKTLSPEFIDLILKINIIIFILLPFLFYAVEFIRLYRNILILNYILFSHVLVMRKRTLIQDASYRILILIFVIFSFWYFIYFQFSDTVFYPLFEQNYLFE